MANDEGYYTGYYEYEYDYRIEYNDTANTVRIRAAHDSLRYMSAVTDSPMEVVAMETDRILFDAPSNPSYDSILLETRRGRRHLRYASPGPACPKISSCGPNHSTETRESPRHHTVSANSDGVSVS